MKFAELNSLSDERLAEIRRKGCVVIRDVVDDEEARTWQAWLREYVSKNPQVYGESAFRYIRIHQMRVLTANLRHAGK